MINLIYKYEVRGKRAKRLLRRYAWAVNQTWNYCVEMQQKVQRTYREGLSARWWSQFDFTKMTAGTSEDLDVHAQTMQSVCAQPWQGLQRESRDLPR